MIIYIAGPMTNMPDKGFPAFFEKEKELKKLGFTVINPARNPAGLRYDHYIDISLAMVRSADALVVLDGYEVSKGALCEIAYAHSLKKPVYYGEIPWLKEKYDKSNYS
jgi:nucleoside 2-deoxyribosyltransferase